MPAIRRFVHILFEVVLSNALFVTIVNFTVLERENQGSFQRFYNVLGTHFISFAYFVYCLLSVNHNLLHLCKIIQFYSAHFLTSCCLLIEFSLNSFGIRIHDWTYNSLLSVTYSAVVVILIVSKAIDDWPYDFLDTETPLCFGWYMSMIIGNMLFYFLAWKLGDLKCKYFSNGLGGSRDSNVAFSTSNGGNRLEKPLLFS